MYVVTVVSLTAVFRISL